MASRIPRLPGPSERGKSGEYRLLYLAQQQINHLQAFSARLQQQIRHLQGLLEHSESQAERTRYEAELKVRRAEAVRGLLPKLRDRLEKIRPADGAEPDPKREKRLGRALDRLSARLAELERAYDAFVADELRPKPPVPPKPVPAEGELDLGSEGDLSLSLGEEQAEPRDLIKAEDPFEGLDADAGDDLDEELGLEESLSIDEGALGGPAEGESPAASGPPPPPAPAPAPAAPGVAPAEFAAARRELERLKQQQRVALGVAGAALVLALVLGLRGRRPAPDPRPPAAPVRAAAAKAAPAEAEPVHPPPLGEQALRLVRERPAARHGTLGRRLASLAPADAPLPEEARWRVAACEGTACDVSYTAGIVDPATGEELLYLFRADVARKDIRGLNEPARVILR